MNNDMDGNPKDQTAVIRMCVSKQVLAARLDHHLEGERDELAAAVSEGLTPWPVSDRFFDALLKKGDYHGVRAWMSGHLCGLGASRGDGSGSSAGSVLDAEASLIHLLIQYHLIDASASQNKRFVDSFISFKSHIGTIRRAYGDLDLTAVGPKNRKCGDVAAIHTANELYRTSIAAIAPYLDLGQIKGVYQCLKESERDGFIREWIGHAAFQRDIAVFFSDELHRMLQDTASANRERRVKTMELARRIDEGLGLIRHKPQPPEMKLPLKPPKKASA